MSEHLEEQKKRAQETPQEQPEFKAEQEETEREFNERENQIEQSLNPVLRLFVLGLRAGIFENPKNPRGLIGAITIVFEKLDTLSLQDFLYAMLLLLNKKRERISKAAYRILVNRIEKAPQPEQDEPEQDEPEQDEPEQDEPEQDKTEPKPNAFIRLIELGLQQGLLTQGHFFEANNDDEYRKLLFRIFNAYYLACYDGEPLQTEDLIAGLLNGLGGYKIPFWEESTEEVIAALKSMDIGLKIGTSFFSYRKQGEINRALDELPKGYLDA